MNYYHSIALMQEKFKEELEQTFQLFDARGKGYIDASALVDNMKELGYEIDKKQITQMIGFLDETGKGVITKEAFLKFMTARLDYRDQQDDFKQAFEYIDNSDKGFIRVGDIQRLCEQLGQQKSECVNIMKEADKDDDGNLNYQEFMRVIKKTSYY